MATIDRDHREVEAHIREAGRESHISYEELKIEILQKRNSLKKITKAQEKLAALFEVRISKLTEHLNEILKNLEDEFRFFPPFFLGDKGGFYFRKMYPHAFTHE